MTTYAHIFHRPTNDPATWRVTYEAKAIYFTALVVGYAVTGADPTKAKNIRGDVDQIELSDASVFKSCLDIATWAGWLVSEGVVCGYCNGSAWCPESNVQDEFGDWHCGACNGSGVRLAWAR